MQPARGRSALIGHVRVEQYMSGWLERTDYVDMHESVHFAEVLFIPLCNVTGA